MYSLLPHKKIISLKGSDREIFLQNLITNDLTQLTSDNLVYSCLLTPQGKFFCDFFIFKNNDQFFLEVSSSRADEIINKLEFYQLRSKVEFYVEEQLNTVIFYDSTTLNVASYQYQDKRFKTPLIRAYLNSDALALLQNSANQQQDELYNQLAIKEKVPEGDIDLINNKSFILEYGLDILGAVDFKKGCYIGQEVIARTHYRGSIRKKLVVIECSSDISEAAKYAFHQGVKVGVLGNRSKNLGLLLIQSEFLEQNFADLLVLDSEQKFKIIN